MGIVVLTLPYVREVVWARKARLTIGLLTAVYGVGQALGPLIAARLVGDAGGFEPALVASSVAVGLAGLLMAVVTLFDQTGSRKENLRGIED
jgi:MFS family permease